MSGSQSVDADAGLALRPRKYQEEIFRKAQQDNVIAVLGTGSGKTMIAVMLIKAVAARVENTDKVIVFLVPSVPLVSQQAAVITESTPLRVEGYFGERGVDMWSRDTWIQEFKTHDVLVMTPQVLKDALSHAHWSMDKISLLVFDECHHTRGNHIYAQIMRDHYSDCDPDSRPLIFGLTASPVWKTNDPVRAIRELQHALFATILTVKTHEDELKKHIPKPKEGIETYRSPPDTYPDYPQPTLMDTLISISAVMSPQFCHPAMQVRYITTKNSLGIQAAERYLMAHVTRRMADHETANADVEMEDFIPPPADDVRAILSEFGHVLSAPDLRMDWLSPKVCKLITILDGLSPKDVKGIIFVQQRQIAEGLVWILSTHPQLSSWVKPAALMGHGGESHSAGMTAKQQRDIVKDFRTGAINIVVATSVALEGLDFPACDLVVRYDPVHHMVDYAQSRGRARHEHSMFIVMGEVDSEDIQRYIRFRNQEPTVQRVIKETGIEKQPEQVQIETDDLDLPSTALAERYVIESTGAMLTLGSAVSLLNNMCAVIPHDRYTKVHQPVYTGDFVATVRLPAALPIPRDKLEYTSTQRPNKREAKHAAAFLAVKELHKLGIFDDYLLSIRRNKRELIAEDADGRKVMDVRLVPNYLLVQVHDPWRLDGQLWSHVVIIRGERTAALVTGTQFPSQKLAFEEDGIIEVSAGELMHFADDGERAYALEVMQEYTLRGIYWCISTSSKVTDSTCLFCPLRPNSSLPDLDALDTMVARTGSRDWNVLRNSDVTDCLATNFCEHGRVYQVIHEDKSMTPLSVPIPVDGVLREEGFNSYQAFYEDRYSRRKKSYVPYDGPMLLLRPFKRFASKEYSLRPQDTPLADGSKMKDSIWTPKKLCLHASLPVSMVNACRKLPKIARFLTDTYRAQAAKRILGLPPIDDALIVEALTLPCVKAAWNNQRFETLGDSFLKLSTVVHLFNRFPNHHEGQLVALLKNCVANRVLLGRALEIGLDRFVISEVQNTKMWPYTSDANAQVTTDGEKLVPVEYVRRSLQDCMEATLGVAFYCGEVDFGLQAGHALSLCTGGITPWKERYKLHEESDTPTLLRSLADSLSYSFRSGHLLLEAVTHASYDTESNLSYQRLELLGDAVIDTVVMKYLFTKFPLAASGALSWARSRAVCAPSLAMVGVKRLNIHKYLLANSFDLHNEIVESIKLLSEMSYSDIILDSWKLAPPKVISDLLEAVIGAVFVDSGWDWDVTEQVTLDVLSDLVDILVPNIPKDPITQLYLWVQKTTGCTRLKFKKAASQPESSRNNCMTLFVHDTPIVGPIAADNLSLAKGTAAIQAREILSDPNSAFYLPNICLCKQQLKATEIIPDEPPNIPEHADEEEETAEPDQTEPELPTFRPESMCSDDEPEEGDDDDEQKPDADIHLTALQGTTTMDIDQSDEAEVEKMVVDN